MSQHPLQTLIDAPLADACKINLPAGRRSAPRERKVGCGEEVGPKLTGKQIAERKAKAAADKEAALFDYYAGTTLSAETVAKHMGLYRQEQTGTDDKGKPIMTRVLDVEYAEGQLAWRRKAA